MLAAQILQRALRARTFCRSRVIIVTLLDLNLMLRQRACFLLLRNSSSPSAYVAQGFSPFIPKRPD